MLDESGTGSTECRRKVASGRRVAIVIRSPVNARCTQLECAKVLHEGLIVLVLIYGNQTMVWGIWAFEQIECLA